MMFLSPSAFLVDPVVSKTVDVVVKDAKKVRTPLIDVADFLPPAAGAYMAHAGEL